MAALGDVLSSLTSGSGSALSTTIFIAIAIFIVSSVLLIIAWVIWKRRKWNLIVEIKLPRNDGRIINGEIGQASYDAKKGVVFVKRKKGKAVPMKIFDIKRYLQGTNLLTVIQVGPEDFRPVLNDSWTKHEVEYVDETKPLLDNNGNSLFDEEGKPMFETTVVKESILNIRTETGHEKAWKAAWEEAARQAYTIQSFLKQYQAPIAVGIVVLCCFIGFAILWTKIPTA